MSIPKPQATTNLLAPATSDSDFPPVGDLLTTTEYCTPELSNNALSDRFFRAASLDAIAVVEHDGTPVGVITRQKFLFTVFRRFGWEIYGKKPIREITDRSALRVSRSDRLDVVLDHALHRSPADVYDDVIVVDEKGLYLGLLSVKQLVVQQSHSLANILVQKDLANTRAQELERIGEIKSQFLANVTHELRSPVNAIIELTELIRTSADRGQIDKLHDRLALLMSSATNLRSVITNMLDLSKIEAGKMTIIEERFELEPLLRELADTTRVLLGSKPIQVEVLVDDPAQELVTDPVKLRQILLNFLSNAAKFTDKGRITIHQRRDEESVAVDVADSGLGIREADLERLFVAFDQLEDAKSKRHGGTGLGLTISRQLSDLLGWRIDVLSQFGRGSTFSLRIPLSSGKEPT
jgi:signal transduction histidine kinase